MPVGMKMQIKENSRGLFLLMLGGAGLLASAANLQAASPVVSCYQLRSPGDAGHDIEQASDLCYGRLGDREGLWTVCDRNGGKAAGRIYRFTPASLEAAKTGGQLNAAEEIVIAPPTEGWPPFAQSHHELGQAVLDHLRTRVAAGLGENAGTALDLEAIAIGESPLPPRAPRLFVVAEEPYSLILELDLGRQGTPTRAELVNAYRYHERDDEHGTDFNDGLEGLAYAGRPGRFWFAEEGTRLHKPDAHPRLFFSDPRLGAADLADCSARIEEPLSDKLTDAVRLQKSGDQQTLNALCATRDGRLLAVDRNGGWILLIDPRHGTAERLFSIYDRAGVNLRQALADFPGKRRMPYVSIEGIALDGHGNIWLVDDPAMPEAFRASCLVRISAGFISTGS